MYPRVHNSRIHNSRNVQTIQRSIKGQADEQMVSMQTGYVMEYYFTVRRETAPTQATIWMKLRNILSERRRMKRMCVMGFHLYEMCR